MPMPGCRGRMRYAHELEIACGYYFHKEANVSSHAVAFEFFRAQMYDEYICALFYFFKNGFVHSVFHTKTFLTAWIKVRCKNALP